MSDARNTLQYWNLFNFIDIYFAYPIYQIYMNKPDLKLNNL